MDEQVDLAVVRRMAAVSMRISHGGPLDETLQAVADGAVEALGFGAAALYYVVAGGDLEVRAVAGPEEARDALEGLVVARPAMDEVMARSERWGDLLFASHELVFDDDPFGWIPHVVVPDGPDAWDPEDALMAPLVAGDGTLVGVLWVDLPPAQRRPGPVLCELLEMFAAHAGVAIDNARLVERLRSEHCRLQASEAAFRFSFNGSTAAMVTLKLDRGDLGRFIDVNDAAARLLGCSPAALAELRWADLVVASEQANAKANMLRFATGHQSHDRQERQLVLRDNTVIWARVTSTVISAAAGREPFLLTHLEDITTRKIREEILVQQAHRDPLTGLPNRRLLLNYLRTAVADAAQTGPAGVVLYGDLDGFKQVNDRHGHAAGDRALQEVARRLQRQVRSADVVARLGGDEFVIVAANLDPSATDLLVERIDEAFSRPLTAVDEVVTISIGVAGFDATTTTDVNGLLRNADKAMYVNKRSGRPL